jgi:hypothetical protein
MRKHIIALASRADGATAFSRDPQSLRWRRHGSAHFQRPIIAFSQREAAAGRTLGIEFEAGAEQGLRNLRAEPPQCPPPRPIAVDDDPQIDVLRHAADQTVRAAERRAAAEHEPHMAERPAQRRRSPQAP